VAHALAAQLAPTGRLRVGVWTVPYFAREQAGALAGIIPDLGTELAHRIGVPVELIGYGNPGALLEAFRADALDVTFLGITAERAQAIDFGPVVLDLQTSYLVPASSAIGSIAEIDRNGVRIVVPARSAQEAYLKKIITQATLIPVAPETPQHALDMLAAGEADAFSHVAAMLAGVQAALPGSRILPGSYFNVPIAIGLAKGRAREVAEFAREFVEDVKTSGFVQAAIARADVKGVVAGR
jgi:polar amino acid transport system substrate-binding protein